MAGRLRRWWRSAVTGRFVSRRYAERHPSTTVEEKTEEPEDGGDD